MDDLSFKTFYRRTRDDESSHLNRSSMSGTTDHHRSDSYQFHRERRYKLAHDDEDNQRERYRNSDERKSYKQDYERSRDSRHYDREPHGERRHHLSRRDEKYRDERQDMSDSSHQDRRRHEGPHGLKESSSSLCESTKVEPNHSKWDQETRVAYADLGTQPSVEYDRRSMASTDQGTPYQKSSTASDGKRGHSYSRGRHHDREDRRRRDSPEEIKTARVQQLLSSETVSGDESSLSSDNEDTTQNGLSSKRHSTVSRRRRSISRSRSHSREERGLNKRSGRSRAHQSDSDSQEDGLHRHDDDRKPDSKRKRKRRDRSSSRDRKRRKRKDKERRKRDKGKDDGDGEERRSVLTGKKIKLKVKKEKGDHERDANREELLKFLNSAFE